MDNIKPLATENNNSTILSFNGINNNNLLATNTNQFNTATKQTNKFLTNNNQKINSNINQQNELKEVCSNDKSAIELRLLVSQRDAGALIGKSGVNIKRLRAKFPAALFNVPSTGASPERVVCVTVSKQQLNEVLTDLIDVLSRLSPSPTTATNSNLSEQSSTNNCWPIELRLLMHASLAGTLIGIGGSSIRQLRHDSQSAIKIFSLCCPLSSDRICAVKAKPALLVKSIQLIQQALESAPIKGLIKNYEAENFDLNTSRLYGGFELPKACNNNNSSNTSSSNSISLQCNQPTIKAHLLVDAAKLCNNNQQQQMHEQNQGLNQSMLSLNSLYCGNNFCPNSDILVQPFVQSVFPAVINQPLQHHYSRFHPYTNLMRLPIRMPHTSKQPQLTRQCINSKGVSNFQHHSKLEVDVQNSKAHKELFAAQSMLLQQAATEFASRQQTSSQIEYQDLTLNYLQALK